MLLTTPFISKVKRVAVRVLMGIFTVSARVFIVWSSLRKASTMAVSVSESSENSLNNSPSILFFTLERVGDGVVHSNSFMISLADVTRTAL